MEVEIWRLRDQLSEMKGRPGRVHCATLVEVHKGMMNLKLRNGNYARKVYPQFARRAPNKPTELPSFIKMNSDVEAKFVQDDGDVVYELGQVLTFLGKEDLVLKLYHDSRKAIVSRKDCRFPSNMPLLNHYKEIDKLKKYHVSVETIVPESVPGGPATAPSQEEKKVEGSAEVEKEDPSSSSSTPNAEESTRAHQETQTQEGVAEVKTRPGEDEEDNHGRYLAISSMMNSYQQKMTNLSSEMEMKLSELSSEYQNLEAKVTEALGKDWPPRLTQGPPPPPPPTNNKSSRNSVESDERSFSQSDTPNPTPPPTVGFPPSHLINQHNGLFYSHSNQFPGYVPVAPSHMGNMPYSRRTLGDKIYNVISSKYNSDEAMKITEDLLSVLI